MTKRAAVIGLDGVAWHLLEPMIEAGVMPNLERLRASGASGVLASTIPTYTPPAWTSAITGVNPGRHGIYGFVAGHVQNERKELMHSGKVRSATIWEMAGAQGARAGIYNVPLTYPPQPLDGWMVSGMMTTSHGERLRGFASPAELESRILEWSPDYMVDLHANWEQDWRDAALCDKALVSLAQRKKVLGALLEAETPDLLYAVLETPDRLQHVYYGYLDPEGPLYDSAAARKIRPRLEECYGAMDEIVGLVDEFAGRDGGVIVCSDHGFTTWKVSVHTNTLLEQWGYLKLKPRARAMQTPLARKLVPVAKRFLPSRMASEAKWKATHGAIDWERTKAFASPIPQQGIFVNLRGRERLGIVDQDELAVLKRAIADRFGSLRGPDGLPVTDRVWLSDEVFSGDAREGAPDVLPVLRSHTYELDDELFHKEPFTDFGDLPRGVHHQDGVVVVSGPGVAPAASVSGSVMDVTPTLLYMARLKVPEDLDGSVLEDAFEGDHLRKEPVASMAPISSDARDESSPYSPEEAAQIEESLRGLGYL